MTTKWTREALEYAAHGHMAMYGSTWLIPEISIGDDLFGTRLTQRIHNHLTGQLGTPSTIDRGEVAYWAMPAQDAQRLLGLSDDDKGVM